MLLYNLLNSPFFIFFIACFSLWASYKMFMRSHNTLEELKRYEFHNRTSRGVVRFKTYEDAERHRELIRGTPGAVGVLSIAVFAAFVWVLVAARDLLEAIFV